MSAESLATAADTLKAAIQLHCQFPSAPVLLDMVDELYAAARLAASAPVGEPEGEWILQRLSSLVGQLETSAFHWGCGGERSYDNELATRAASSEALGLIADLRARLAAQSAPTTEPTV